MILANKWREIYSTYLRNSNPGICQDRVDNLFSQTSESLMDFYKSSGREEGFGEFLSGYMSYYQKINEYYDKVGERVVGFVNPTKSRYLP